MASLLHEDSHHLVEGFLKSWGMILVSEIGDKTFFIAAIMAMKNPRRTVFAGAISALALMTVLSALLGWAAPNLISRKYTHYAAVVLFLVFGLRSLYDAFTSEPGGESELAEVERELQEGEKKSRGSVGNGADKTPNGRDHNAKAKQRGGALLLRRLLSPIFLEAFVLTFLAEWGDRSQIATIGLAASIDVVGVTLGGILGHAICTGVAVLGGRQIADHIDERTVGIIGGLLFLVFGVHAMFDTVPS